MKKITLKNLYEATLQEVFDQCSVHLLIQNEKCAISHETGGITLCRYKNNGKSCAAGCFIDEDEYIPAIESKSFDWVVEYLGQDSKHENVMLILKLQRLHDYEEVANWRSELKKLAYKYNLNTNAIEKFQS